ncbi:MAG: hypothetical protein ACREVG_09065, partial [Burkholderiales bacterium]
MNARPLALPWLACTAALAALFGALQPYWETNDDVAMAMIVHGYGIAAAPDPATVFQNVLYGRLVQALPEPFGLQGYGVATYGLLLLSFAACCLALQRAGAPRVPAAVALFAIFAPALVYPQFTLVAGLLGAAGGLILCAPASRLSIVECALGSTLLVVAALVRLDEVLFLGVIVSPFLLGAARTDRSRRRRLVALACAALL